MKKTRFKILKSRIKYSGLFSIMKSFSLKLKLDKWILTFEWESSAFFNTSVPAKVEYGEHELEKTKPENFVNWILKLEYRGYPGLQLPEIEWSQGSNPLKNTEIQNFRLIRNSLHRYLEVHYSFVNLYKMMLERVDKK